MSNDNADNQNNAKKGPSLDLQNLPDLLTVREVAEILRVSPLTIKRWGKRGKLPAIRINSRGDRRYRRRETESGHEEERAVDAVPCHNYPVRGRG